jgi:twinkle protein
MIPMSEITFDSLPKRKLTKETTSKWRYGVSTYNTRPCHVATYFDDDGSPVAQKLRFPDKSFMILGNADAMGLYGSRMWKEGGKHLCITEGELDALSVSQVMGNKWPVVSIPNGVSTAKRVLQENLAYCEKFERIVLMFDNDEKGREAAKECTELFTPGKCAVALLPLKDASDMLQAGRDGEIISAFWDARVIRPDGIVNGNELWEKISVEEANDAIMYPWSGLNKLLYGCRKREIVTLCAGTGVGKTSVCSEIEHAFLQNPEEKVGVLKLEQGVKQSAYQLMGIEINKRLWIREVRDNVSEEEKREAFDATVGCGRYFLYDHWGSSDVDNLLSKIRYMVKGCGCTTIVLDHISIVVSGIEEGEERRLIDNLMTRLRSLVEEVNCRLILVSHLKRPDGKGHEEGAQTSLSQLRGSAAIGQLSDIVIGLERNQQDTETGNFTQVRVLKNRFAGETGPACVLSYDRNTGRLSQHEESVFATQGDSEL